MPSIVIMLPVRQKQVVEKIIQEGFDPKEFEFIPLSNDGFDINYKPISDYTLHRHQKLTQIYTMCPGANGQIINSVKSEGFNNLLDHLACWLKAIKENIEIGNPWEVFDDIKEKMNAVNFDSYEEMLNDDDQKKVVQKLDLLLNYFIELKTESIQIKADIEHLKMMSGKISKKDWILLLLGNITNWFFTGLISTVDSSSVWGYAKYLFFGFKNKFLS